MKTTTISLGVAISLATSLYGNNYPSDVVISSATKSSQSIKDVTSNVNVITKEDIAEKHIKTLAEALNLISGVELTSNGGVGSNTELMLRGTSNNRVLVLLDGVRYKDHSNIAGTNISHLLINDVERIEVVKGAQSGIWGADAAAGVINIIIKEAKEGFSASSQLQTGSNDSKYLGASLGYKTSKYDAKLSVTRVDTDSISSQTPKGENHKNYEDDPYKNTTISSKVGYNITPNSRVQFAYTRIDAKKDYDSFNSPDDDTMQSDVTNNIYSTQYTHEFGNHFMKLQYDESRFNREEIGATFGVKKTQGKNHQIELNDKWNYHDKDFLIAGVGYSNEEAFFEQVNGAKENKNSRSKFIYLTNSNIFEQFIFTQSLRYDQYDNFDNKTTGKIGAKYHFTSSLNVFANYGTAYSVPLIVKNINPWGTPNPDLQPEETKGFDVGVEYKGLKITAFENRVKELIDWTGGQYVNVEGKSKFKGIEIEYMQALGEKVFFHNSFTRLSAKDDNGQNLARRARFTFKSSLDYYVLPQLHLNLNASYVGTRYNDANDEGVQTGRYTVWNGSINYDINSYVQLYAKLDNITDKNYQVVDGFATPKRSIYVGVKAKF
jgi:vitamin B12 transporter